jgi:acyl phosphate:glycerol-3-phosphate acyltransferase
MIDLGVVLVAYLLGSIPFSFLVVKAWIGRDVRTLGSGNVGVANVTRAAGKAMGLLAFILDAGKGVAAVLLAQGLGSPPPVVGFAAFAAVLGHSLPVFLGFRGGRGGATGLGVLVVLAPPAALLSAVILVLVVAWKRYVSLGTMVSALAAPLLVLGCQWLGWIRAQGPWLPLTAAAISALILLRHHDNWERLCAGTEPKIGDGGVSAEAAGPWEKGTQRSEPKGRI